MSSITVSDSDVRGERSPSRRAPDSGCREAISNLQNGSIRVPISVGEAGAGWIADGLEGAHREGAPFCMLRAVSLSGLPG
jgi:hypothetical protein